MNYDANGHAWDLASRCRGCGMLRHWRGAKDICAKKYKRPTEPRVIEAEGEDVTPRPIRRRAHRYFARS